MCCRDFGKSKQVGVGLTTGPDISFLYPSLVINPAEDKEVSIT
jgi:hypothetical protein